ncbi:MAG: hypothetical protein WD646_02710 [Actinomycetota bacterium]
MGGGNRDLNVRYTADASQVLREQKKIGKGNDQVGAGLKKFGQGAKKVGDALTVGVTAPLLLLASKSAKAFRESQAAIGQTRAVIKSTGGAANVTAGDVDKLASSMQKLTAFDDEAVTQSSNLLLTFKNVRNEVGKGNKIFDQAQTAILDMATAMNKGVSEGADLESATIMIGKALNDPIKGIAAMGRAGVQFSDDQKKAIKALVESGDLLGAQNIMLGELKDQFGGSAEAYAQGAGKVAQATNRMGEAEEKLGAAIDPIRVKMYEKLAGGAEALAGAFEKLSPGMQDVVVHAGAIAIVLGPVLSVVSRLSTAVSTWKMAKAAKDIASVGAAAGTAQGAGKLGGVATKLGLIKGLLASPFTLVIGTAAAVAGVSILLDKLGIVDKQMRDINSIPIAPKISLDDSDIHEKVPAAGTVLNTFAETTATAKLDANDAPAKSTISSTGSALDNVGAVHTMSTLDATGAPARSEINGVHGDLNGLTGHTARPRVEVDPGNSKSIVDRVKGWIGSIANKTVTIFQRIVKLFHDGGLVSPAASFHGGGNVGRREVDAKLIPGEYVNDPRTTGFFTPSFFANLKGLRNTRQGELVKRIALMHDGGPVGGLSGGNRGLAIRLAAGGSSPRGSRSSMVVNNYNTVNVSGGGGGGGRDQQLARTIRDELIRMQRRGQMGIG